MSFREFSGRAFGDGHVQDLTATPMRKRAVSFLVEVMSDAVSPGLCGLQTWRSA